MAKKLQLGGDDEQSVIVPNTQLPTEQPTEVVEPVAVVAPTAEPITEPVQPTKQPVVEPVEPPKEPSVEPSEPPKTAGIGIGIGKPKENPKGTYRYFSPNGTFTILPKRG